VKTIHTVVVLLLACTLLGCASNGRKPPEAAGGVIAENAIVPLTKSEEADIRDQIERNWNLGEFAASPNLADRVIQVRIELQPDGTVTSVEVLNDEAGNSDFRQAAESARRAIMISSPLRLPPGKTYKSMRLNFHPDKLLQ
jgi:membrane protein involved in colicin uptake